MMRHLIAYDETTAAGTTDDQIDAVTGTAETVQNGRHILRDDSPLWLVGAYVQGTSLTRSRVSAPSLRQVLQPQIRPITVGSAPPTDPNFALWLPNPIRLTAWEEIALQNTNSLAMGSERHVGGLFLTDGQHQVPRGQRYVIRATGTTTLVANAWTNVPLTFDDSLPAGSYEVIGMEAQSATGVLARMIIPGQYWRGGVVCITALGNRGAPFIYDHSMGSFGLFRTTALPSVEFLATAADTAQIVFFDIIRR